MPALRKAGSKPFTKEIISKGYGFHTPQDGSVCKIKIILDDRQVITDLDDAKEKEIVVGDVDEPIDRILEDCIRTMKEEEDCLLKFVHPCLNDDCYIPEDIAEEVTPNASEITETEGMIEKDLTSQPNSPPESTDKEGDEDSGPSDNTQECKDVSESQIDNLESKDNSDDPSKDVDADATTQDDSKIPDNKACANVVEIRFQLLSYTREPEIWEMSITEKWRRASYHKQRGLVLYSRGAYQYAFRRFGLTLKYVISLEHDVPSGQEEGMDIKGLKLSCYLNVAACQMRHHNFESVVINSTKALDLQPNNAKALYRRGSAHLQLQEFEKAKEDLGLAQQLEPKNQAIAKQQQLLKCQVQKLNQYYASAMKKLFS